ncbi:CD63 antigen, partial [Lonchura striata]
MAAEGALKCVKFLVFFFSFVFCFTVLLSLIFLLELAAAVTGYVFKNKVHGLVEDGLWAAVRGYEGDAALSATVDGIQRELSCCGVNNYTDWASVGSFGANDSVPSSCCRQPGASCNLRPTPATVFAKGCLPSLEAWVGRNVVVLAAMALGVAFFEVRDPRDG